MTPVLLAIASAALFGGMTVALRVGLSKRDASIGAAATVIPALGVALVAVAVDAAARGPDLHGVWPFALAGLLAPGASQILFTLAVRDAGASRSSIVVGTAPLVSVGIALAVLHEPVRVPLLAGAVLIVAGGLALAGERDRPEHVRAIGLAFAALCTVMFATRDNLVRWLADGEAPHPSTAAATTLLVGAFVALAWARRLPRAGELRAFVPAGLCFGLSYLLLFEAFYRGRVSVVAPLVATESLWGVMLTALLLRHERVRFRLVTGALLVVAGGVLIGIFR